MVMEGRHIHNIQEHAEPASVGSSSPKIGLKKVDPSRWDVYQLLAGFH